MSGARLRRRLDLAARYAVLCGAALVFILPVMLMVASSLKPDQQLLADTASFRAFLPVGDISLQNYRDMFRRAPIGLFVFNSLLVTGLTVGLALLVCSMAAFSFVFVPWRWRRHGLTAVLATYILPLESVAIPLLLLVNNLPWFALGEGLTVGWLNSYHVQIVPFLSNGLVIFIFVQYFKDMPGELIEAARAEGASWPQIYRRVVMPLAGPAVATAAIVHFIYMYNMYLWPLISVQSEQYRPVLVGLRYFDQLDVAWGEKMAYLSLVTVPVLVFYLALQRVFIASIASAGVKG